MKNTTKFYVIMTVVSLLVAAAVISGFKDDSLLLEQKQYCKMVHTYQQTEGAYGWPDYDNVYATSCNADGTVKAEG